MAMLFVLYLTEQHAFIKIGDTVFAGEPLSHRGFFFIEITRWFQPKKQQQCLENKA